MWELKISQVDDENLVVGERNVSPVLTKLSEPFLCWTNFFETIRLLQRCGTFDHPLFGGYYRILNSGDCLHTIPDPALFSLCLNM